MRDETIFSTFTANSNKTTEIKNKLSLIPHPSSLKVLLWDIDGTLMCSNRTGAYKEYFIPTLEEVYGTAGSLESMQVSGMTDTQIAYEALKDKGFTVADIVAKIDKFIAVLGEKMADSIARIDNPYGVFGGVREILSETGKNPIFVNSLLTGNISVAAEIKLRSVDLWHFFDGKPHAFGEVSHQRGELAKFAGRKFNEYFQLELNPQQFIVIGDTPNDIACAREFGAKAVAVGTGRSHSATELAKFSPDVVFENLSDVTNVINILQSI